MWVNLEEGESFVFSLIPFIYEKSEPVWEIGQTRTSF